MKCEDVEKLKLIPGDAIDLATGKPSKYTVRGLPSYLEAEIRGGQSKYKFYLNRVGDGAYEQRQWVPDGETAFKELKALLKWDRPLGLTRK